MTNPQSPIRVLAVTHNDLMLDLIQTAVERESNYLYINGSDILDLPMLLQTIEQREANYLLLDHLYTGIEVDDIIDDVSLRFPELVIIVILPQENIAAANKIILAGARAFIVQPFSQNQLLAVLERMQELQQRVLQSKTAASSVPTLPAHMGTYVVFSPKGGVGCSSVSVNLATALIDLLKQEVLLVDGKLLFGDLDIMLNLKTQNSIADLIPHAGALDESLIRDVVSEHVSGLKVLPSPTNPSVAHGIHPEELHMTVTALQSVFSHMIVDSGNYLNENVVTFMDACHKILLVINPDIACLRDASRFFELCRTTLSFPRDKILVIVNQYDARDGLGIADIERALQTKVFATLPWDRRATLQSINGGVPVVMQPQSTPLRKAFQTMAKDLVAITGHAEVDLTHARKNLPEVLAKSSRLG